MAAISKKDYRKLGHTDILVSPLALGTYEFDRTVYDTDDRGAINIIRTAIDLGINFFDTAEAYAGGHTEELLGEAVRQSGKDAVIVSKLATWGVEPGSENDARWIRKSVENSLRRLNRDYIDVYLIHWPTARISMKWVVEELGKLKAEGKLFAIGVSNFSVEELEFARRGGDIAVLQNPYSLVWRCHERGVLPYCLENGISVMAYSPLGSGILSGVFTRDRRPQQLTNPQKAYHLYKEPYYGMCMEVIDVISAICSDKGYEFSNVALSWLLSKSAVTSTLIGIQKKEQLLQNVKALEVRLTDEEIRLLESAGADMLNAIDAEMSKSMTGWYPDKKY